MTVTPEQLQTILDTLPVSVALIRPNMTLGYANRRLADALQLAPSEVVGRTWLDLGIRPDDWGDWSHPVRQVFQTGTDSRLDHLHQRDGKPRLVRAKFVGLRNDTDEVESVVVLALIDNELEELRQTLADSEQRFNAFMDALPLAAWLRDEEERYVYLNPAYQRLMQADPREWYGRHVREMWPVETAELYLQNDQKLLESGQPLQIEEIGLTPTGEWKTWYNVKFAYRDSRQRTYYGGVGLDVTRMKEAERSRLAFEKQLLQSQKFESLGVLAGGVAHDFNNILTSILGFATLCKMQFPQTDDQPLFRNLTQIEQSALRAAELCQQMLAYSGRGQLVIRQENVNTIIEQMASLLATVIRKQIVLKTYLSELCLDIQCDASQVRQTIMNLVTNASDAIGERSGVITVTTGVIDADAKYLEDLQVAEPLQPGRFTYIEVSDTGCGMADDIKSRIFEPFFTTKFIGRGLGLSAVQGIMRGHGGCVKVYTQQGKGSTFKVLFPVMESAEERTSVSKPEVELPASYGASRHILVVDDEEDVRVLTRKFLQNVGFQVTLASNGLEAVEQFRAQPDQFALVIMDLTMPKMNGQDAFRELRMIRPDVQVILTSGYNEAEAMSGFQGKGLGGFLSKPFRLQDLLKLMQQLLKG